MAQIEFEHPVDAASVRNAVLRVVKNILKITILNNRRNNIKNAIWMISRAKWCLAWIKVAPYQIPNLESQLEMG